MSSPHVAKSRPQRGTQSLRPLGQTPPEHPHSGTRTSAGVTEAGCQYNEEDHGLDPQDGEYETRALRRPRPTAERISPISFLLVPFGPRPPTRRSSG